MAPTRSTNRTWTKDQSGIEKPDFDRYNLDYWRTTSSLLVRSKKTPLRKSQKRLYWFIIILGHHHFPLSYAKLSHSSWGPTTATNYLLSFANNVGAILQGFLRGQRFSRHQQVLAWPTMSRANINHDHPWIHSWRLKSKALSVYSWKSLNDTLPLPIRL